MSVLLFLIVIIGAFFSEVVSFFVINQPTIHLHIMIFSVLILELTLFEKAVILGAACLVAQLLYGAATLPFWYFIPALVFAGYGKRYVNEVLVSLAVSAFSIMMFLYRVQLLGVGLEKPYTVGMVCATLILTSILSLTHNYYRVKQGNRS